jgi:hypothetical protein
MPLKVYCPNNKCSSAIEYSLQKPIYCPYCGVELNKSISSIPIPEKNSDELGKPRKDKSKPTSLKDRLNKTKKIQAEENTEEEEFIDDIDVDISKFDAVVESFGDNKGIKFSELAGQQKTGLKPRPVPKRINVKKEIEAFIAEASRPAKVEITDGGSE